MKRDSNFGKLFGVEFKSSAPAEFKDFSLEIKATSEDGSTGEGIASAFHNIDSYGDIVGPTFFDDDLKSGRLIKDGFVGGMNHDWDNPIGKITKAEKTPEGLLVGWKISDTAHGKDVKQLLKDGVVKKLSIGFSTLGSERLDTADDVNAYWKANNYTPSAQDKARAANGSVRHLTKGRTYEFSPVTVPANDRADITSIKQFTELSARDLERILRDAGLSRKQAVAVALHGHKAFQRDADEGDDESNSAKLGADVDSSMKAATERLRTETLRRRSRLAPAAAGA